MTNIPITKPLLPSKNAYMQTLSASWNAGQLTNFGDLHARLEAELTARTGTHAAMVANGTLAITAALCAFDLRGEVVTTPFTYPATAQAIVAAGCSPVFCDISLDTLCLGAQDLPITSKTVAILPVHVFGTLCDLAGFEQYRPALKVIYDAAHAFDLDVAAAGDAAAYSLHATKLFHAIEGGMVTTKDAKAFEKIKLFRSFGMDGGDIVDYGINAKLSEAHAAMGLCVLPMVEQEREKRKAIAAVYTQRLNVPGIAVYTAANAQYYVIRIEPNYASRDGVLAALQQNGVCARAYFTPSLCDSTYFKDALNACPNARIAANTCLALPFYGELREDQAEEICRIILACGR